MKVAGHPGTRNVVSLHVGHLASQPCPTCSPSSSVMSTSIIEVDIKLKYHQASLMSATVSVEYKAGLMVPPWCLIDFD